MSPDREEVLRMAREANLLQAVDAKDGYIRDGIYLNELKAFYALAYEAGARAEEAKLRRGEYICGNCGLRQDAKDQPKPDF